MLLLNVNFWVVTHLLATTQCHSRHLCSLTYLYFESFRAFPELSCECGTSHVVQGKALTISQSDRGSVWR
jgi:hypothetical protein